jgi:hypothetical protein
MSNRDERSEKIMDKHAGPWRVKLDNLTVAGGLPESVARDMAADLVRQASDRAYALPGAWTVKAADLEKSIKEGSADFGKVGQWLISVQREE